MKYSLALFSVSLLLVACAATPRAPTVAPSPEGDHTCGINEVRCVEQMGDELVPTGFCCAQDYKCGGAWPNVGCPADSCCFTGHSFGPDEPFVFGSERAIPQIVAQKRMP